MAGQLLISRQRRQGGTPSRPAFLQPQMGRSRKGDMVPSKDEAKKISARLRQASKKFFDDFYAKEAKAGRYPWPHEAMAVLGRILKRATEGEWPPQPPGRPGVCDNELEGLLSPRFFHQVYQVACDAHVRHMPGLQKRAGRPRKDDLAHEAAELKRGGLSYRQIAIRLKLMRTDGTPNGELVRGLLKSRRLKARKATSPPDKTRN